jgi:hypothetical protein
MRLLFTAVHWHSLAKLHMHTDLMLDELDNATTLLGQHFCTFQNIVCSAYETRELQQEADAHNHHQSKKARKEPGTNTGANAKSTPARTSNACRKKALDLCTYKYHSLGDYVATIWMYGTTDSYSTQPVEYCPLNHTLYPLINMLRVNLNIQTQKQDTVAQTIEYIVSS